MKWFVGSAFILLVALAFNLGLLAYAMYALLAVMIVSRFLAKTWIESLSATRECNRVSANIGQSVAVKERDIIAVEAMEGTDEMIHRAGRLCRVGGWTMVKVARPSQDMRFDVPTVGPQTIRNLRDARCVCLVLEADKTFIVDKPATLAVADRVKIAVIGKRGQAPKSESEG